MRSRNPVIALHAVKLPDPQPAYLPGFSPRPAPFDPADAEPLDLRSTKPNIVFEDGIALFDAGYYWEAHERWEVLWHAAGRVGREADLLRGLIKLAAAALKIRQGRPRRVAATGAAAVEHFERACGADTTVGGLAAERLRALAEWLRGPGARAIGNPDAPIEVVFPHRLRDAEGPGAL